MTTHHYILTYKKIVFENIPQMPLWGNFILFIGGTKNGGSKNWFDLFEDRWKSF
ncbi:MAG TPA: hypothetical protein VK957_01890 [Lunatimonas sp.]|nr:hypothetical protein [Lunatimonas sp.]